MSRFSVLLLLLPLLLGSSLFHANNFEFTSSLPFPSRELKDQLERVNQVLSQTNSVPLKTGLQQHFSDFEKLLGTLSKKPEEYISPVNELVRKMEMLLQQTQATDTIQEMIIVGELTALAQCAVKMNLLSSLHASITISLGSDGGVKVLNSNDSIEVKVITRPESVPKALLKQQQQLSPTFKAPTIAEIFKKYQNAKRMRDELLLEEEKTTKGKKNKNAMKSKETVKKGKASKNSKKPNKSQNSAKSKKESEGKAGETNSSVGHSDEVKQLSSQLSSLSFVDKPENWGHTEAWRTTALLHVAQDCWDNVLYPELRRRYPNPNGQPAQFSWASLINSKSSQKFNFCVKVVDKRTAIVKSDEVFKFLPNVDTIHELLWKRTGNNVDKEILEYILTFATGSRLIETPKVESTVMDEQSAQFKLTILGLHRACEKSEQALEKTEKVTGFCKLIGSLRQHQAHPQEFNQKQIEALKVELKDWINSK